MATLGFLLGVAFFVADEASEMTEQTKINISSFVFAMMESENQSE
jgi:hypothetical protein